MYIADLQQLILWSGLAHHMMEKYGGEAHDLAGKLLGDPMSPEKFEMSKLEARLTHLKLKDLALEQKLEYEKLKAEAELQAIRKPDSEEEIN
jgi:hypothetical protein